MSNTAIYSKVIQVRGPDNTIRPYDIVITGPGIKGDIQDPRITKAIVDLFLKTVAAVNQEDPQNISEQALNRTVLKINPRNQAFIKIDQEEKVANEVTVNELTPQTQQISGLANRVAITAQDTIFAIRELQHAENVEARVNLRRGRASSPIISPISASATSQRVSSSSKIPRFDDEDDEKYPVDSTRDSRTRNQDLRERVKRRIPRRSN